MLGCARDEQRRARADAQRGGQRLAQIAAQTGQTVWVEVLHVLPHRGGGAEAYVDQLELLPGHRHRRVALSGPRGRMRATPSVASRLPKVARLARAADV